MIGSGVDFDSNPITIMFDVGEVSKRVNISVSCDQLVEEEETFDVNLKSTNNSQVVLSNAKFVGIIMDSTGK